MELSDGENDDSEKRCAATDSDCSSGGTTRDVKIARLDDDSCSSCSLLPKAADQRKDGDKRREERSSPLLCQTAISSSSDSRDLIANDNLHQTERERLEKQIALLQQALQGMQHQLITLSAQKTKDGEEISTLRTLLQSTESVITQNSAFENNEASTPESNEISNKTIENGKNETGEISGSEREEQFVSANQISQTHLISLIAIYVNVHPNGVSQDDIEAFVTSQTPFSHLLSPHYLESLLACHPQLFCKNSNRLWRFTGFNDVYQN